MLIICIGLTISGVFLISKLDTSETRQVMYDSLAAYDSHNQTEESELWDSMQEDYKCCGVDSFADWPLCNDHYGMGLWECPLIINQPVNKKNLPKEDSFPMVPGSCCDPKYGKEECHIYPNGCYGHVWHYLSIRIKTIFGSLITITVLLLAELGIAVPLAFMQRARCLPSIDLNPDVNEGDPSITRPLNFQNI